MSNRTLIQWYTNLNKSILKILSLSTHKNAKNNNLNKLIKIEVIMFGETPCTHIL